MQRTILSTLTAALLATAIPLASFAAPPSAAEPGDLIDDWLAEVAFTGLALSPDGNRLAFATRQDDPVRDVEEHTLWWIDLAAPEPRKPVRLTTGQREFPELRWAGGDLLVTGSGEEKEGRATNTEGRLHRLEAGQLARIAPDLEGSLQEAVPLADGSVLLTAMISTRTRIYRVEPATSRARTLADHRGTITLFAASRDGSRIAFVRFDRRFPEIWLADGPTDNPDGFAAARVLTSFNAKLDRHPPPEIETVSWSNGEGDTIEGVLLWPPGCKGAKGLPLVVSLHGGPYGVARQEALSLGGTVTTIPGLLASRGFLVLAPNFRGGAGRGDAFAQAIEGHRCSRQSADVITGVEHLIAHGWADRARLGVSGYSGGGVLTNCLIGRTDLFRAAVSGAGRWDDAALAGSPRGALWAESFYQGRFPWDDPARYQEESPSARAANVKTPTLIVYGERDGAEQGAQIYWSLFWRGVPAELQIYPGEGHIFTRPSHKRTKVLTEIAWLERHLLGQLE